MESAWIGIDIGTSSVKVVALADDGTLIARASRAIGTVRTAERVEQDPSEWLAATDACLQELRAAVPAPTAIGVVGHVPTLVVVDDTLTPMRPAIIWQDARASDQAAKLEKALGDATAHLGIALPWSASQLPAMLAWVRQHEPAVQRAARWLLSPKDLVVAHLTGVVATDSWTSKGLVTVPNGTPAQPILDAIDWDPATIPPAHRPWEVVGHTLNSSEMHAGVPVVAGWSDALAAMLAAGAFTNDRDFVLTGTSDIVGSSSSAATGDIAGLLRIPHALAGREILYGPTSSGGGVIAWAASLLGCTVQELVDLAKTATPSAATFAPYLGGERAPLWDDQLRGLVAGLSMSDGRAEFARAVMRGVTSTAAAILARCAEHGRGGRREIHVVGRGALEGAWPAVRAEVLGRRQLVHHDSQGSALGAAMLAWAGAHDGDLAGAQRLAPSPVAVDPPSASPAAAANEGAARHARVTALATQWRAEQP